MKHIQPYKNFLFLENLSAGLEGQQLIKEAGAFGHLSHIFEDMDLTFEDLKMMINMLMEEGFSLDGIVQEKLDGANLLFSWKNNELICARNPSHLKKMGENALTVSDIKNLFKGRGLLDEMFSSAVDDLSHALKKLGQKHLEEMFQEGKCFMSVEVMYSKSENSVPYNVDFLGFHGLIEYNDEGKAIGPLDKKQGIKLDKLLKDVNANIGKTFKLIMPDIVTIIKKNDFSDKAKDYKKQLDDLQKEFNLKDSDEVGKYHTEWFKELVSKKAKSFNFDISEDLLNKIAKRFGLQDKTAIKATEFKKIDNKEFANWIESYNKQDYEKEYISNIRKFEMIFAKVGVDVLQSLSSYLALDKEKSTEEIKRKVKQASDQILKQDDAAKIKTVVDNLTKIEELGGIDKIAPSEGIVFFHKGKVYKLTGMFTSMHRIVSLLKF